MTIDLGQEYTIYRDGDDDENHLDIWVSNGLTDPTNHSTIAKWQPLL